MQETYIGNYTSIIYESIKDNDNLFAIGILLLWGIIENIIFVLHVHFFYHFTTLIKRLMEKSCTA